MGNIHEYSIHRECKIIKHHRIDYIHCVYTIFTYYIYIYTVYMSYDVFHANQIKNCFSLEYLTTGYHWLPHFQGYQSPPAWRCLQAPGQRVTHQRRRCHKLAHWAGGGPTMQKKLEKAVCIVWISWGPLGKWRYHEDVLRSATMMKTIQVLVLSVCEQMEVWVW